MKRRNLQAVLLISLALAIVAAVTIWTFINLNASGRDAVLREVPKATWQFVLVGLIGGFVTYVLNRQRDTDARVDADIREQLIREDALDEYRRAVLQRTAAITKIIRGARIRVGVDRSFSTYREQMQTVIDAYLDLRALVHDIDGLGAGVSNDAFHLWWPLVRRLLKEDMQAYLERLIEEFASQGSQVNTDPADLPVRLGGWFGRRHSRHGTSDSEWQRLRALPMLQDMMLEGQLAAGEEKLMHTKYYAQYLQPYQEALQLMRKELVSSAARRGAISAGRLPKHQLGLGEASADRARQSGDAPGDVQAPTGRSCLEPPTSRPVLSCLLS
jgi:hypothetical protein